MNALVFDTHAFVKRLTAAGMPEAQAEILADEQARLIDERLATKDDVAPLATKEEARLIELRLEAKIEASKADILRWMIGAIGFQTLVLLGAIVALAKTLH